ncbi:MAG: hypothetical protein IPK83_25115 [Planctomycetes bacterium]|nr:hypothetical protein [Planctomycetota bacterium]
MAHQPQSLGALGQLVDEAGGHLKVGHRDHDAAGEFFERGDDGFEIHHGPCGGGTNLRQFLNQRGDVLQLAKHLDQLGALGFAGAGRNEFLGDDDAPAA